jgi:hypothetical protein
VDHEFFNNEEVIDPDCLYDEIVQEIRNLPTHYREIIEDRIVDKMKYKDIAEKRGLKINTVRSRIHSAKKVIKNLWIEKKKKSGSNKNINILGVAILKLLDEDAPKAKKLVNADIKIISAKYGSEKAWVDVTDKCSKIFESNGEIKSCNHLGGDPCYGHRKKLILEYSIGGKTILMEVKEGNTFTLN